MITFIFNIGEAFVNYHSHPITIPKRYFQSMEKEGFVKERQDVTIICPDGAKAIGHIYSSVSSWSPYYQLLFDTPYINPVKSLKVGDVIFVDIYKDGSQGFVSLRSINDAQTANTVFTFAEPEEITEAIDIEVPPEEPGREIITVSRIIRDTKLSTEIKELYKCRCQVCGFRVEFDNGQLYAESHHIKPLGTPHDGPDSRDNILCVCPNCHAKLDYGAIQIEPRKINVAVDAIPLCQDYIDYHNKRIYRKPNILLPNQALKLTE